jgi:hypothetical protein
LGFVFSPRPFVAQPGRAAGRGQKFGKRPYFDKKLVSARNPLKRNKTAKEIFGKAWQKTPLFRKNLAKKLGWRALFHTL